jgi:hypothetical protein
MEKTPRWARGSVVMKAAFSHGDRGRLVALGSRFVISSACSGVPLSGIAGRGSS